MSKKSWKKVLKVIFYLGLLLMIAGLYGGVGPDNGMWLFMLGFFLVFICFFDRELRAYIYSLLGIK